MHSYQVLIIGSGFGGTFLKGSQHNDLFENRDGRAIDAANTVRCADAIGFAGDRRAAIGRALDQFMIEADLADCPRRATRKVRFENGKVVLARAHDIHRVNAERRADIPPPRSQR